MNELVSIIIPVYNAEKYIEKCLNSIINQTYTNLEIILINDGSNDNTEKICDEFRKNDKRILLFSKENSGVSSSRNIGIKCAKGEYITFVDADDWLEFDYITKAMELIKKTKCDMLKTNYQIFETENNHYISYQYSDNYCKIDHNRMLKILTIDGNFNCVWGTFYKNSIFKNNNLEFDENISFGEDLLFQVKNYKLFKKIYWLNLPGYIYYCSPNSASRKKNINHLIKVSNDVYVVYNYLYAIENNLYPIYGIMLPIINRNLKYILRNYNVTFNEFKKMYFDILKSNVYNIKFNMLSNINENILNKLLIYLIANKNLRIYYCIMKISRICSKERMK